MVANKADRPEFMKMDEVELNMSTITGEGIEQVMDRLLEMIEENASGLSKRHLQKSRMTNPLSNSFSPAFRASCYSDILKCSEYPEMFRIS